MIAKRFEFVAKNISIASPKYPAAANYIGVVAVKHLNQQVPDKNIYAYLV